MTAHSLSIEWLGHDWGPKNLPIARRGYHSRISSTWQLSYWRTQCSNLPSHRSFGVTISGGQQNTDIHPIRRSVFHMDSGQYWCQGGCCETDPRTALMSAVMVSIEKNLKTHETNHWCIFVQISDTITRPDFVKEVSLVNATDLHPLCQCSNRAKVGLVFCLHV